MRKFLLPATAILLLAATAYAERPIRNVGGKAHPNLAAAQKFSQQAWEKISQAQKANEWDMEGHAEKAKRLLDEVKNELKLAAGAANRNKGK